MNITNIELRHLRYFVAVADELSFSRAALKLHMSQPPLSQQILEMETRLETKLFARTKRKVELTRAGLTLLPRARRLLRDAEDCLWAARAAGRGQVGDLRIGTIFSAPLVPAFAQIITQFTKANPTTRISIKEMKHGQLLKALESKDIDVAFTWDILPIPNKRWGMQILSSDPLNFYISHDHLIARKKHISIADLAHEPILVTSLQTKMDFFDDLRLFARRQNVVLHIVEESAHFTVITNLVAANIGLGVLPSYVARLATSPLKAIKIKGMPPENMVIRLSLVYCADNMNEALAKLRHIV